MMGSVTGRKKLYTTKAKTWKLFSVTALSLIISKVLVISLPPGN